MRSYRAAPPPTSVAEVYRGYLVKDLRYTPPPTWKPTTHLAETPCAQFYLGKKANHLGEYITSFLSPGDPGRPVSSSLWLKALEDRHDYIQLLFPLRTPGVNPHAPLLTSLDAYAMRSQPRVLHRVWSAVEMMLWFYGFELGLRRDGGPGEQRKRLRDVPACEEEEEVSSRTTAPSPSEGVGDSDVVTMTLRMRRWSDTAVCADRQQNLRDHPHNNLRISRILFFLAEMHWDALQLALLRLLMREVLAEGASGTLWRCRDSLENFWVDTVVDTSEREKLHKEIQNYLAGREGGGSVQRQGKGETGLVVMSLPSSVYSERVAVAR